MKKRAVDRSTALEVLATTTWTAAITIGAEPGEFKIEQT